MCGQYGSGLFTEEEKKELRADGVHMHAVLAADPDIPARLEAFARDLEHEFANSTDAIEISIPAPCSDMLATAARAYIQKLGLLCLGEGGCNYRSVSTDKCEVRDRTLPVTFTVDTNTDLAGSATSDAFRAFHAARAPHYVARKTKSYKDARDIVSSIVQALKGGAPTPYTYVFEEPNRQPVDLVIQMLRELQYKASCPLVNTALEVDYNVHQAWGTTLELTCRARRVMENEENYRKRAKASEEEAEAEGVPDASAGATQPME